jgi:DNA-binding Xre family transcriptional regulator
MKKYNNLTEQSKYDALAEQYRELAIKYAITMQGLKKIKMGSCRIITINNMGNILEYLEIHTT